MEAPNSMALSLPQALGPVGQALMPLGVPPESFGPRTLNDPGASLRICEPGYRWNDKTGSCVVEISPRAPKCTYGFKKNVRMDECRRIRYEVDGKRGKMFDRTARETTKTPYGNENLSDHRPYPKRPTPKEDWYGYGYNFGRHYPHD